MKLDFSFSLKRCWKTFINITIACGLVVPQYVFAFPIYAQQAYTNPREANGRIVCANCHLAQKPTEFEAPSSVLPNSIFETTVKIPYDPSARQILGNGQKGSLNVGAIVILPEGFRLAPKAQLEENLKEKMKGIFITPYSANQENILVVGPLANHQEITFPILSPDPKENKSVYFVKYPIFVGANRGRGQVYPTGEKTNNNLFTATNDGKIENLTNTEKGTELQILTTEGKIETQILPKGLSVLIKRNENVKKDQPLTNNPNIGGFGQTEKEIVLQDPARIYAYMVFCFSIIVSQAFFVFKKKQFEKVQLAELDF